MGILDRFKTLVGGKPRELDPKGPLALLAGDVLEYYSERMVVTGVRILTGEGSVVYHYCLIGPQRERIVLVAEEGPEPLFSIQRVVEAQLDWTADVLEDIDEEPFRLAQHGRMKVQVYGDTGTPDAKAVDYREYTDASGERMVVLDDFGGKREVRVGEPAFEGELHFASGHDRTGSRPWIQADAPEGEQLTMAMDPAEICKGSPLAAVLALEGRSSGALESAEDVDPTAYDDDEWADAQDPAKKQARMSGPMTAELTDAKDVWLEAVKFVAGSGEDVETEPDDWLEG